MSTISKVWVVICGLLLFTTPTIAAEQQSAAALLQASMSSSMDAIFTDLQGWCIKLLGTFILIQFTWTNIRQLLDGADLEKVLAKLFGSFFWFGICLYAFTNGPDFIKSVSNYLMQKATTVSGASFSASYPVDLGIQVTSSLLEALDNSQSILGSLNPFPSIMMGLVSVVILAVCALVAFKIFMIFIETKIVIALSPLSFALLGLDAFRDQGMAPFKYLVSLAYRMMILAAVLTAMSVFSKNIIASFATLPAASDPSVWPPIWAAAIGYALLGALALRADSIAAMLASGSSNMSPGDAAAVGAAAGAAAGVAVGVASKGIDVAHGTAGAAVKAPQLMSDVMKSLTSGGAVKNESGSGRGGMGNFSSLNSMAPSPSLKAGGPSGGGPATGGKADSGAAHGSSMPAENPCPSNPTPLGVEPSASAGSGTSAGISGSGGGSASEGSLAQTLDRLSKSLDSMNAPKAASLGDQLKNLSDHVTRDSAGVHVSMNTHHS